MSEVTVPIVPYNLRAIYVRSCTAEMSASFDPTLPQQMLEGEFRVLDGSATCHEAEMIDQDGRQAKMKICLFTTRFDFRYTLRDGPQVAQISAEIAADYQYNGMEFPEEAALIKWAKGNVLLHTWPYWREFCHSSLVRMHLPVTMMPLISLEPPPAANLSEPTTTKPKKTRRKQQMIEQKSG